MLEQLQKHYAGKIVTSLDDSDAQHTWLKTPTGEKFAIDLDSLTKSEASLLLSLCQLDQNDSVLTHHENQWHQVLFNNRPYEGKGSFRFLHFFFKQHLQEPAAFRQAIEGLFSRSSVFVLHPDQKSGVIIEQEISDCDEEAYSGFKELVTSDLYMDVQLFAGIWHQDSADPAAVFQSERGAFQSSTSMLPPKDVYALSDIIPYLLLNGAAPYTKQMLSSILPEEILQDKEMVQSIKIYIESGFNISVAAKKLYIHRNSLQYRVDRFAERTGIDVRQFQEALPVYFALL
ncbi:PucR family transcriptional regulator [Fictibacillus iocasae]|uniref:PucR family transcriptional regulator n=1 Tax=Fictibacillus iocasae TaxID=2715437 RepID=A0ABW2NU80_9BACL